VRSGSVAADVMIKSVNRECQQGLGRLKVSEVGFERFRPVCARPLPSYGRDFGRRARDIWANASPTAQKKRTAAPRESETA
jgi:hypothetical protein